MKKNYENLETALDVSSDIVEVEKKSTEIDISQSTYNDLKKDYEYTRTNL